MLLITPVFKQKQSVKVNLSEAGGLFQCSHPLAKKYSIVALIQLLYLVANKQTVSQNCFCLIAEHERYLKHIK